MLIQESNVLILKPTSVFLSFLSEQLPDVPTLSLNECKTNHTAYTFKKQASDEATLAEIERHFPDMLQYEAHRILGPHREETLKASFLDFLCCFKFELHSQIVLMEPSIQAGRQLLCVKPRLGLLHWMKASTHPAASEWYAAREALRLSDLTDNATMLVKNFAHEADVQPFIHHYYRPLFKAEMFRFCDEAQYWPEVTSLQMFNRYFSVHHYTEVVHLH